MSNSSKTFRLFISSTFSDFQVEREVLQTKVFPEIKEYCSSKGYAFQPIDLRWGVNNEAQLDQKALDMCTKEVQSCKQHHYPNFLIMQGDRYGWLPLPNIIEQNEFNQIVQSLNIGDKEYLSSWYYEDSNQIPTSYILKQRTNEYVEYKKWLEVETKLRDILQTAVSDLAESVKKKYFTSATEAEAIEGIISYSQKSEFQQKLIQLIPNLEQIDHKNIFGFFRNIDQKTIIEDKFISVDYDKAQSFKEQVRAKLIDENTLNISTCQVSKDRLDEKYLYKFIVLVTNFLKQQVNYQILKDEKQNYSDLELEKLQQQFFMNQKLKNFLGQEKILNEIQNYIGNKDNKPLIVCGQSGIGKSSIIAKAIEDTANQTSKRIVYRFIGATPNSTTTKDMLASILRELNISTEGKQAKNNENNLLTDIDKEGNNFVKFSNKVHNELINLSDDILIFIDAVDQFVNDDQFLWLPNELPYNVKIIISALKDREHKNDSKYFYALKDKFSNYIEVDSFDKPIELLELLLSHKKRTLQLDQKEYFLKQYKQVNTPLYVYMAANQLQYWKSTDSLDSDVTLSPSQKGIVKSFIENLTVIHHHEKLLLQKIFGYILASKDGLSEHEILELLNVDKEFIRNIVPNTWHQNTNQELPLVIWSRFHNHIKQFLNKKNKNGQELLYFFHREFEDVIKTQHKQKYEHECIIEATQKLILKYQNDEFDSNRWGKLYITLLGRYYLIYNDKNKIVKYCTFIHNIFNEKWIAQYINEIQKIGKVYYTNGKLTKSLNYRKIAYFTLELLNKSSHIWAFPYIQSSHNIASVYCQLDKIKDAIKLEEKNLIFIDNISDDQRVLSIEYSKKIYNEVDELNSDDTHALASQIWTQSYLSSLSVLSSSYSKNNEIEKAIELDQKGVYICESLLYSSKEPFWLKYYLGFLENLAESFSKNKEIKKAIELQEKALSLVENAYDKNTGYLVEDYGRILNSLSVFLVDSAPRRSKELQAKSIEILSALYQHNPDRYANQLLMANTNKIDIGIEKGNIDDLESYYKKSIKTIDKIENVKKLEWIEENSNHLLIKSHELFKEEKIEQSIKYLDLYKKIIEHVYTQDREYWAKPYVQALLALSKVLDDNNQNAEAVSFQEESIEICKKYFTYNKVDWGDLYTKALNNLSTTYKAIKLVNKALTLDLINIDVSKQLYNEDSVKWYRAYYYALTNISDTYFLLKNQSKSDDFLKESYVMKAEKFILQPDEFKEDVTLLFKDYDNAYEKIEVKEMLKSLFQLDELLKVCAIMYKKDLKWTMPYIELLNEVAQGYAKCPSPYSGKKIRQHTNNSLKIIKPLVKQYPDEWATVYKNIIKNKRNLQKILYRTYFFGAIPILIILAIIYFMFK